MTSRAQTIESSAGASVRIISDRHADRRQRVPELVPEHRQELVLATPGLLDRLLRVPLLGEVDAAADVTFERTVGLDVRDPVVEHPAIHPLDRRSRNCTIIGSRRVKAASHTFVHRSRSSGWIDSIQPAPSSSFE